MSSGSVNMTGVNSCVFTQVFYFESIFQKHVCLSPLVLGWTSLVWIWFWFWSADWRIKCVAAVPDCDHWGAVNTPPARQHRHPYTDSFKIKAQVKEIYPVCRFVSKHSCQQLFNFICRWVYVLMQRLLRGLLNIHIWMNERMNERMNEWMSLLKPLDNISNQYKYKLITGGGEGVVVHSKWCIVGVVLRQQKVSRTGTGRSTKLPSGNTDHTGSGLIDHQNKSIDITSV